MSRIEEIYEHVLPHMEENNIEDTTENRLLFLQAMLDAWIEDPEENVEKSLYKLAVQSEIAMLMLEVRGFKVR